MARLARRVGIYASHCLLASGERGAKQNWAAMLTRAFGDWAGPGLVGDMHVVIIFRSLLLASLAARLARQHVFLYVWIRRTVCGVRCAVCVSCSTLVARAWLPVANSEGTLGLP
jgi:hypothetical protein